MSVVIYGLWLEGCLAGPMRTMALEKMLGQVLLSATASKTPTRGLVEESLIDTDRALSQF